MEILISLPVSNVDSTSYIRKSNLNHMKVILFGSTGMIGKAVLLECLDHESIEEIKVVNRNPLGMDHAKLSEILHQDFHDFTSIKDELSGYDACFFPLGVSALGLSENEYRKITYDITLSAAR